MAAKHNSPRRALQTLGKYLETKLAAKHPLPPEIVECAGKAFEAASKENRGRHKRSASRPRATGPAFSDQFEEVLSKLSDPWLARQIELAAESFNREQSSGWTSPEIMKVEVLDKIAAAIRQYWPQIKNVDFMAEKHSVESGGKALAEVKDLLSENRILEIVVRTNDRSQLLAGEYALMQRIAKILHDWVLVEIPVRPVAKTIQTSTKRKVGAGKRSKSSSSVTH